MASNWKRYIVISIFLDEDFKILRKSEHTVSDMTIKNAVHVQSPFISTNHSQSLTFFADFRISNSLGLTDNVASRSSQPQVSADASRSRGKVVEL